MKIIRLNESSADYNNYESLNYYKNDSRGAFFNFINWRSKKVDEPCDCREIFHTDCWNYGNIQYIGFVSGGCDIVKVKEFFEAIAENLGTNTVPEFFFTQQVHAFVVKVPRFWRQSSFYRELFTLFLRCAFAFYRKNNSVELALKKYNLTRNKEMLRFINAFLSGRKVRSKFKKMNLHNSPSGLSGICDCLKQINYKLEEIFIN